MFTWNRRAVVRGIAGAIGFGGAWTSALSQGTVSKRYGAHTSEGKAMLSIYVEAIKKMMDKSVIPETDPRSWMFQWYTHAVRPDRSKDAEIKKMYKATDPHRAVAQAMWNTCEAHFNSSRENYFLPWHRLYLRFFEDVVRQVSGKPEFTLPYWDYTSSAYRALPEEFRKEGDAKWGPLFRTDRNAHANKGQPIDDWMMAGDVSLDAMRSAVYGSTPSDAGFCANIDGTLHGNVHGNIGNSRGMGSVPWAAADPIFWLHHCNIDRIWASWNRAGGKNPQDSKFLNETFTFANANAAAVKARVSEIVDGGGVEYDLYPERPEGSLAFPTGGPTPVAAATTLQSGAGTRLGAKAVRVKLRAGTGTGPSPVSAIDFGAVPPTAAVLLRLERLTAAGEVPGSFDVHLAAGAALDPTRNADSFIGSFNFFGAAGHQGHHGSHGASGRTISFVLGSRQRAALESLGTTTPDVLIVPKGNSGAGQATLGRAQLIIQ